MRPQGRAVERAPDAEAGVVMSRPVHMLVVEEAKPFRGRTGETVAAVRCGECDDKVGVLYDCLADRTLHAYWAPGDLPISLGFVGYTNDERYPTILRSRQLYDLMARIGRCHQVQLDALHTSSVPVPMPEGTSSEAVPQWTLGDRLRKVRRVNGLTQDQFAALLGVNAKSLAAWESDKQSPRRYILMAIAAQLEGQFGLPRMWTLGLQPQASGNVAAEVAQ